LRGKQFELIAIRELLENSLLSDKIIPIVEPVKLSSTLIKTVQTFLVTNRQLALIRNPRVGGFLLDLKKEKNVLLKEKLKELIKENGIIDVYFLNPHFKQSITKYFDKIGEKIILDKARIMDEKIDELQVWRYDPAFLSKNNIVDVVSLSLSLSEINDERIEQALEKRMEVEEWYMG